jgi:hypothetical protein
VAVPTSARLKRRDAQFVSEQAIFLRTRHGYPLGIALRFEPRERPSRDDPALTAAPEAFLTLLRRLRPELDL